MQFLINAASYWGVVTLFSLALFLQYRLFRYFDLSLGSIFLIGAYTLLTTLRSDQSPPTGFILGAMLGLASSGILLVALVGPLARLRASPLELTLSALGIYIVGVNVAAIFFGDELLRPPEGLRISALVALGGGVISVAQLGAVFLALLGLVLVGAALGTTPAGRTFRAISDNANLANNLGLATKATVSIATAIGAMLVSVTGALVALDIGVRPNTPFSLIIAGLAALLAFGARSLPQLILGTVVVAVSAELGGFVLGQQWREFSIFVAASLFLVLRTRTKFMARL